MFAPSAGPRRKNDGAAFPPQKLALSAMRRGRFLFGPSLPLKHFAWRRLFPKKKAPHSRAGPVGWVANGI
jgi:hypothetical protein